MKATWWRKPIIGFAIIETTWRDGKVSIRSEPIIADTFDPENYETIELDQDSGVPPEVTEKIVGTVPAWPGMFAVYTDGLKSDDLIGFDGFNGSPELESTWRKAAEANTDKIAKREAAK